MLKHTHTHTYAHTHTHAHTHPHTHTLLLSLSPSLSLSLSLSLPLSLSSSLLIYLSLSVNFHWIECCQRNRVLYAAKDTCQQLLLTSSRHFGRLSSSPNPELNISVIEGMNVSNAREVNATRTLPGRVFRSCVYHSVFIRRVFFKNVFRDLYDSRSAGKASVVYRIYLSYWRVVGVWGVAWGCGGKLKVDIRKIGKKYKQTNNTHTHTHKKNNNKKTLLRNWGFSLGKFGEPSLGKTSCDRVALPQPTVHAAYISVSIIHRTLTWATGFITCAQMLMQAIALGESALKADAGRKTPCRTWKSIMRQRRAVPTLY